jgi:hypothetical protein
MFLGKARIAVILVLAAGLLVAGVGVLRHQTATAQQAKDSAAPAADLADNGIQQLN